MSSRMAFLGAFFSVDPAYAGMILGFIQSDQCDPGGPRVCGDDPDIVSRAFVLGKWTPRMRG